MRNLGFFKSWFSVFLISGFIGCTTDFSAHQASNLQKHKDYNTTSLSKGGEEVGVLPDGRKVIRYSVVVPSTWSTADEHFVYVVDKTVTVNRSVRVGKGKKNEATVFIDE
jgi:hypothetical protein